jgi:hypothetical protein
MQETADRLAGGSASRVRFRISASNPVDGKRSRNPKKHGAPLFQGAP